MPWNWPELPSETEQMRYKIYKTQSIRDDNCRRQATVLKEWPENGTCIICDNVIDWRYLLRDHTTTDTILRHNAYSIPLSSLPLSVSPSLSPPPPLPLSPIPSTLSPSYPQSLSPCPSALSLFCLSSFLPTLSLSLFPVSARFSLAPAPLSLTLHSPPTVWCRGRWKGGSFRAESPSLRLDQVRI